MITALLNTKVSHIQVHLSFWLLAILKDEELSAGPYSCGKPTSVHGANLTL